VPNVEFAVSNNGWGGDFEIDATGDVVLATDIQNAPLATQQRLYRLIMTNPRLFDAFGNPISYPNDLFAPDYGAGVRALTGQMITPALTSAIQSHIMDALASDPTVAATPAPVVTVAQAANNTVQVSVICTAVTGELITVPSFPLPISGS
jgi:hypothetical protein